MRFPGFEGEWIGTKLGEVFSIFNGYAFSSSDATDMGTPWIKIADVGIQEMKKDNLSYLPAALKAKHTKFILKKGDYVIALTRPILNGKLKMARIDDFFDGALLNQRVGKIETNNSNGFIYCYLQKNELIGAIENSIAGSDPPNLSPKEINGIELFMPSYSEQVKIADFLLQIDLRIQTQSKIIKDLETSMRMLRDSLLSQRIRFKNTQNDNSDWENKKLKDISERIVVKNRENNQNILTISAQHGLISQLDFFNKSVAAKDVTGYLLVKKNEFAYNKSYSNGYPMGAIKRQKLYEKGVVSTLYICFSLHSDIDLDFMEHYFESGILNSEIEKVAQEGARNHGLLNIGISDFFNISITLPTIKEQTKIGAFLTTKQQKINLEKDLLELYKNQKKYLLDKLFI